jgi:hypothetical protein
MKEVTRAYEQQDLARLMQLENLHEASGPVDATSGSSEERLQKLEGAVSELRRQLRELSKVIRGVRGSEHSELARQLESGGSLGEFLQAAERELAGLAALREHLTRLLDGRLSWQDFVDAADARAISFEMTRASSDEREPAAAARRRRRKVRVA